MHFVVIGPAGDRADDLPVTVLRGKAEFVIAKDDAILFAEPGKLVMDKLTDGVIYFIYPPDDCFSHPDLPFPACFPSYSSGFPE